MKKYLEVIKSFKNKDMWIENMNYNTFIDYFNCVDVSDKNDIEVYYLVFKDLDRSKLEDKDKFILDYLDNKIDSLLKESKVRRLKIKEVRFLSLMLGRLVLNNKDVSDDVINNYVNNCYFLNRNIGVSSDLIILLKYSLIYLNDINNSDIEFLFEDDNFMGEAFAKFISNGDKLDEKIVVTNRYCENFIDSSDRIDLYVFYYFLIHQTMSMLHEYRHYMQFKVINRESFNEFEARLKKEFMIIANGSNLYNERGNSFFIEIDANRYAIDNIDYFFKGIIPDGCYNEVKSEVIESFDKLISDADISDEIDREYKKLVKKQKKNR